MVGDTLSDRGKNQGHITKTQITEIVHALSLAVNVFLNLSAMNFENYSTTLTNFSISLNPKKNKKSICDYTRCRLSFPTKPMLNS